MVSQSNGRGGWSRTRKARAAAAHQPSLGYHAKGMLQITKAELRAQSEKAIKEWTEKRRIEMLRKIAGTP